MHPVLKLSLHVRVADVNPLPRAFPRKATATGADATEPLSATCGRQVRARGSAARLSRVDGRRLANQEAWQTSGAGRTKLPAPHVIQPDARALPPRAFDVAGAYARPL